MKNNNSRSNEMLAFNVLLSSMSFVEDGETLCFKKEYNQSGDSLVMNTQHSAGRTAVGSVNG